VVTDHKFTSQKLDGTGLYYYNTRYYDPDLGHFISPDTIVPDPTDLFAYNRYMYTRGNPMKYVDPTGHWLESGLDIISLGMTVKDINDNGLNWENGIGLAADVVSLAAPGVAGGGTVVRYADDAYAAGKAGVNTAWDWGKRALGYGDEAADSTVDAGKAANNLPCPVNSFSAETLVATENGLKPIDEVTEGELVYAYNEATGEVGLYPVTDEIAHLDSRIVTLTIDGERIYTTPEHPFYANGQWIDAGKLRIGDLVRRLDGRMGDVEAVIVEERQQVMYNLTVAEAHTFFVGEQQWLVHNCDYVYGEHVLKRMADNPSDLGHNFPTALDKDILSGKPAVIRANGQQEFLQRGSLNESKGVYHITLGSDGKTITHRFFIGESDWDRFSKKHALPALEDIQ
jgi:RHS repeat-associated protein